MSSDDEQEDMVMGRYMGDQPEWLRAAVRKDRMNDEVIFAAPDGTWTVWEWISGQREPIHGLTQSQAEQISHALQEVSRSAVRNAGYDD